MTCCSSGYCFFFKQKTAYEMRISDWSADVCSSDPSIKAIVPIDGAIGRKCANEDNVGKYRARLWRARQTFTTDQLSCNSRQEAQGNPNTDQPAINPNLHGRIVQRHIFAANSEI